MLPISEKEHKNYLQLLDLWVSVLVPQYSAAVSELLAIAKF